jgi:hypothetical protein
VGGAKARVGIRMEHSGFGQPRPNARKVAGPRHAELTAAAQNAASPAGRRLSRKQVPDADKVALVDGVEHRDHHMLDDLIFQRRNARVSL